MTLYVKINLMLPTYHRVKNGKLVAFMESLYKTVKDQSKICITFLINKDDKETAEYLDTLTIEKQVLINESIEKPHLGKFYNRIYNETKFNQDSTIVSMLGDDMEFRTSGWEQKIIDKINEIQGIGFIYCNDMNQEKRLPVNLFTTRKFVKLTKYPFMCEWFAADYIDTVWKYVGEYLHCGYYLTDVIMKHNHYTVTMEKRDVTSIRLHQVKFIRNKGNRLVKNYANCIIRNLMKKGMRP